MPPPKSAALQLKKTALETVKAWAEEFGAGYKKLALGYNYLRQVKKVDFSDLEARSELQRRVEGERRKKAENVWRERVKRVRKEMEEARWEVEECVTQLDACFALLRPDPAGEFDLGTGPADEGAEDSDDDDDEASRRVHGLANAGQSIEVSIGASGHAEETVEETSDNEAVLENLRDQYAVLVNKLIPLAKKWTVTLTKAGREVAEEDLLKKSIDLKVRKLNFIISFQSFLLYL